jgi:hypothetical protein
MAFFQSAVFVFGLDLGPTFLFVATGVDGSTVAGCVGVEPAPGAGSSLPDPNERRPVGGMRLVEQGCGSVRGAAPVNGRAR